MEFSAATRFLVSSYHLSRSKTLQANPYRLQSYLQINMMIYMLTDGRNSSVSFLQQNFYYFEAKIDFFLLPTTHAFALSSSHAAFSRIAQ
jgi:hypothetical protein